MGFSIKVDGARFDDDKVFNSLSLPFLNGLTAEFVFSESLLNSSRNRASGVAEASEIGSPTWNSDSVSYSTSSVNTGLQLVTSTAPQNTFIVVAEKEWGSGGLAFGGNIGLYGSTVDGTCTFSAGAYTGATNRARIPKTSLPSGFVCFAARGQAGALGKITAWNAGTPVEATANALDGAATTGVVQLGGNDGVNSNGSFKVAYFAHFSRVLTDEECSEVYVAVKAFMAGRGVLVS